MKSKNPIITLIDFYAKIDEINEKGSIIPSHKLPIQNLNQPLYVLSLKSLLVNRPKIQSKILAEFLKNSIKNIFPELTWKSTMKSMKDLQLQLRNLKPVYIKFRLFKEKIHFEENQANVSALNKV